jgi:predicted  nucleic acid-binding Zn-ribbon protein
MSDEVRSLPEQLLSLQAVDTEADQLEHRRARSPLRDALTAASTAMADWERRRAALAGRIEELAGSIEAAERRGGDLATQKRRLEDQLKTVIAPREAEALMHEIATIDGEVDELDLAEIEALEEQSRLDDELAAHLAGQEPLATALRLADDALAAEVADIDRDLAGLDDRRDDLRRGVPADVLATYDRKRAALGVAVAVLEGRQCLGCHLELSPAEVDTVKDDALATGVTDCPQCGRLLVV